VTLGVPSSDAGCDRRERAARAGLELDPRGCLGSRANVVLGECLFGLARADGPLRPAPPNRPSRCPSSGDGWL
jgi:hypothetical protein